MVNRKTVNWGIMGAGGIAGRFAQTVSACPCAKLVGVASKTEEKAKAFAQQHNVPNFYSSYEQLVQNKDIDSIYVATTHNFHYENMMLALKNGKNVLCEKAFTLTANQAKEAIDLARQKGLFLMEAFMTRFLPVNNSIKRLINSGEIGKILNITSTFGGEMPTDENNRFYSPDLGGGALLDLGIYPLSYTLFLLGKMPTDITSEMTLTKTGVDETTKMHLTFDDGCTADLCASLVKRCACTVITCEKGTITVDAFVGRPTATVRYNSGKVDKILTKTESTYIHELNHACDKILSSQTESDVIPLDTTYEIMRIIDGVRHEHGFYFPIEK